MSARVNLVTMWLSIMAFGHSEAATASGSTIQVVPVDTILKLERPLLPGEFAWNEQGVPQGTLKLVADLDSHLMYVYRSGAEIGRARLIFGADEKPTPLGHFPILEKKARHTSNLYGAPMPFMLRLTNDGISIHASTVDYVSATHGCIGVPEAFAIILYRAAKVGDVVYVTRGWMREHYTDELPFVLTELAVEPRAVAE